MQPNLRDLNILSFINMLTADKRDSVIAFSKDQGGAYTKEVLLKDLFTMADSFANYISEQGLGDAPGLVVFGENSHHWLTAQLAAYACGGYFAGFYVNDSREDIVHKLNDGSFSVLLVDHNYICKFDSLEPEAIRHLKLIVVNSNDGLIPEEINGVKAVSLKTVLSTEGMAQGLFEKGSGVAYDKLCQLVYTSGTSGLSKGVMLNHLNYMSAVASAKEVAELKPSSRLISYLPNAHIFQSLLDMMALSGGHSIYYSHKSSLAEDLPKVKPNIFAGVPKVYKMLAMGINAKVEEMTKGAMNIFSDQFSPATGGAMIKHAMGFAETDYFICGAAKLDEDLAKLYKSKLDIELLEGYGMSETCAIISVSRPGNVRFGAAGKVQPGTSIRIVDEDGKPVGQGLSGQITVKGDTIFAGYMNHPDKTDEVFKDGWFYTGDMGYVDVEGFVHIEGRAGNRVKFANGEFYNLEAIGDNLLNRTQLVGQVAVIGENRDYPVAIVTLAEDLIVASKLAMKNGILFDNPESLIYNEAILGAVKQELAKIMPVLGTVNKMYSIKKYVYMRPFSPANGESTTTQKLKLKLITKKYATLIDQVYDEGLGEDNWFKVHKV